MPRKKTNHAWIDDDSLRRTAFKKGRDGLLKKVSEISTLCDLEVCAVVYGPHDAEPGVYPNLPEATMILQSFKELTEIEQCRKMMTQETFLEAKLNKSLQQYRKLEKKIQDIHSRTILYEFMSGSDMNELDVQEARNVYQTAGSMQKIGEWMMTFMEKGGNSSEVVMRVPAITNEDFHLDAAIASYIKEPMMQDQNQQSVSNVLNQQLKFQQPVINYHVNDQMTHQQDGMRANVYQQLMIQKPGNNHVHNQKQKQKMVVPFANNQIMHQQAAMRATVYQPMSSNVHPNCCNMETGNQVLAKLNEVDLWNDLELFGSL